MKRGTACRQLLNLIVELGLDVYGPKARIFAYCRWLVESGKLSDTHAFGILYSETTYIEAMRLAPDPTRYPSEEELYAEGRPDIEIGTIPSTDLRVGFNIDPPRHALVIGETGAGKSTSLRRHVLEIDAWARRRQRRISILIFDAKKDFPDMRSLGDHWRNFSAASNLRVGFNPPGSVKRLRAWNSQVCEILGAHLDLIASVPVLMRVMAWMLPLLNPEGSAPLLFPTPNQIAGVLKRSPFGLWGDKRAYAETLINTVGGLAESAGPLLDNECGLLVEEHLVSEGLSAVIDLANLKPASLRWIITGILLAQILFARLERGYKTDQTDLVVVIDEADTLIAKSLDAAYVDGLSIVGQLLKQAREFGVMVLLGSTVMGNISRFVLEDVSRFVVFNQADRVAKWEAARTLGLPQGAEDFLSLLKPGECIMRQSLTVWPYPLRVIADYVAPNRGQS